MVCITGVSGSGKSTLINETLRPHLSRTLYRSFDQALPFERIEGVENIDKLVVVDQSPIGRSPRSNPATYTNVFADIRKLFEKTPDAQVRGFTASRFSFNVKGGRCEECEGEGVIKVGMQFMADVELTCEACGGMRFKPEILEVKYREKNIYDILNMSVDEAVEFFGEDKANSTCKRIVDRILPLQQVGLGYVKLGQSSSTLSGGESQRVKLASFLTKDKSSERLIFIFDEPTTGLHFHDIRRLLGAFDALIERGHSVVVVEHNMEVIKCADWVIDLGPEGGDGGGTIVAEGTPEHLVTCEGSWTGRFLAPMLERASCDMHQ